MYDLIKLPYQYNALEPNIDEKTVLIHYERHHRGYLNNLNRLLEEVGYKGNYTLLELVQNIDEFPMNKRDDILFNVGGVLNHNLYWLSMSPEKNIIPNGKLKEAIDNEYGSFENFKNEFIRLANLLKGSGYTFLVVNREDKLEIINTPNQETPYVYGLTPIMALDLWEHAYYLSYQNRRSDYINNFFNIVNFKEIGKLYEEAIQKK